VREGGREEVVVSLGARRFGFGRAGVCCGSGGRGPASGGGGGGGPLWWGWEEAMPAEYAWAARQILRS